jgi:hypothetical protein
MCADGDISREEYRQKKQKIKTQLSKLEKEALNSRGEKEDLTEEDIQHHYESLAAFVEMKAFDSCAKLPETLIEAFVDKIIYDKGTFSWYLNPKYGNEIFVIDTTDWKKSMLNRKKKQQPRRCLNG